MALSGVTVQDREMVQKVITVGASTHIGGIKCLRRGKSAFSGTATPGTNGNLYFRVRYDRTLDSPGASTLPIRLVLTAP